MERTDSDHPAVNKRSHTQKFRSEYSDKYPCIIESNLSNRHAFCKLCRCDIQVSCGGTSDIVDHFKTKKYQANAIAEAHSLHASTRITSLFSNAELLETIRAEVAFTDFLDEHSLPLAAADHTGSGSLFRKMFPHSSIAKRYACAQTKTHHDVDTLAYIMKVRTVLHSELTHRVSALPQMEVMTWSR